MSKLHGVLFDMDGLLFDSERVGVEMMQLAGRKMGFSIPKSVIHLGLGCTKERDREIYLQYFPQLDYDALWEEFIRQMLLYARNSGMPVKRGAAELIAFLQEKKIPMALATSSGKNVVETYLKNTPFQNAFSAIICGSGQFPSKPAPDIFLKGAQSLGIPPEFCAVFEDSVNGVKAGRAAGCIVCMVPDLIPFTEELSPYVDHVFADLFEGKSLFAA